MEIVIKDGNVIVFTEKQYCHMDLAVSIRIIADEIEKEALKPKVVELK